jgi:hypothetical protein
MKGNGIFILLTSWPRVEYILGVLVIKNHSHTKSRIHEGKDSEF